MPTNTKLSPRVLQYSTQQVHYLRADFTFADEGNLVLLGAIPNGSIILPAMSGILTVTAFNDSGTNTVDLGFRAAPTFLVSGASAAAAGWDGLSNHTSLFSDPTSSYEVVARYNGQNNDATAGSAVAILGFIPQNTPYS
jgi:hypothetical protein